MGYCRDMFDSPSYAKGVETETMSRREALANSVKSLDTRSLLLGRGLHLDDHDWCTQRTHARDHVRGAWLLLT